MDNFGLLSDYLQDQETLFPFNDLPEVNVDEDNWHPIFLTQQSVREISYHSEVQEEIDFLMFADGDKPDPPPVEVPYCLPDTTKMKEITVPQPVVTKYVPQVEEISDDEGSIPNVPKKDHMRYFIVLFDFYVFRS